MHFPSLIVCFLFTIIGHCTVPPSPDFNLTDAGGDWNVAAFFSTEKDYGMTFYSNATFSLTVGLLDIVKISLNYIESFMRVEINETLVSSPLNHAILISPYSPTPENEFVVTYYNSTSGELVAINSAMTVGIALSRNDNPYHNNFSSTITEIFNNLSLPLSNLTFVFNSNWDTQGLVPASQNNIFISGMLYGSAIFTTNPFLQDLECFSLGIYNLIDSINVTINLTHSTNQQSDIANYSFAISSNVYASNQYVNFPAVVIIYANSTVSSQSSTEIYAAATADRKYGFVFSNEPPSQIDLTLAKQALVKNGLVINSTNFYEMSTVCQFNLTSVENILF